MNKLSNLTEIIFLSTFLKFSGGLVPSYACELPIFVKRQSHSPRNSNWFELKPEVPETCPLKIKLGLSCELSVEHFLATSSQELPSKTCLRGNFQGLVPRYCRPLHDLTIVYREFVAGHFRGGIWRRSSED